MAIRWPTLFASLVPEANSVTEAVFHVLADCHLTQAKISGDRETPMSHAVQTPSESVFLADN
jgi:hypothetical protein